MMTAQIHTLTLTSAEMTALDAILEFYIRLGLGQLSDIATRLRLLTHKRPESVTEEVVTALSELEKQLFAGERPWRLEDSETAANTILAFMLQAKVQGNMAALEWASGRLREMRGEPL